MIEAVFMGLRARRYGEAAARARESQRAHWQAQAAADPVVFMRQLRSEPGPGRVMIARGRDSDGRPCWLGLPTTSLLGAHGLVTGGTGSGKTFFVLSLLLQVIPTGFPVVVFDLKGELASLLIDVALPALTARPGGSLWLDHLRIVRPFDSEYLPHLRITEPEPGVEPAAQAYALTTAVEEALDEPLGPRMRRILLRLASLAVERGAAFPVIGEWLADPARFARAAAQSRDEGLRYYAANEFAREAKTSLDALRARLDVFLLLPQTRLTLSAPTCVSFASSLEAGVTIVDCSHPPLGQERLSRFWSSLLFGRLTRAILSRSIDEATPPALVIGEEWQEALGAHQADQWGRLLSLARFKRTAIWAVNQAPVQIAEVSATLLRLLRTNVGFEVIFRSSYEDAALLAPQLVTPVHERSITDVRQELIRQIATLPRRSFFLLAKDTGCPPQLVRSPRVDLERLREQAMRASRQTRRMVRQGTVASAPEELALTQRADSGDGEPPVLFDDLLRSVSRSEAEATPGFPVLG